ncbi:extracellular solute-binding protein [Ruminiclostridium cellobioparum]|uniref:ABC-type sugar transport system, periplasmic component n=1 Tax=Ruminiclostridium cellobioparum subsp. termitidis CT1112 TaxID=1195236 RepID=S0FVA1_RUMCE|nr:extracellular solute-binding protein [Ruminiclostridium cellobioparum]EMS72458.1 ABC-type sugar transport system, periplasmic component [Ruminiclostridium cellobioparum subsp. termitidis CT1112]
MGRKVISLILAGCMTFSVLLAGCGNKNEAPDSTPQTSTETSTTAAAKPVSIEYWQYFYETKVNLMDELIKEFQGANSNITVVQKHFPYDSYQQKVAAAVSAGSGPDIINLYYGWVPKYVKSGTLQQLPEASFSAEKIESTFAPMVKVNKIDGKYYTVPTAVRTLGLFWNKDIFKANGLDPEKPPKTLEELVEMAKKCTKIENGKLEIEGLTFQPSGQLHSWFRPVLLKQFGQEPISADQKTVQWNASENGYKAFEFLVNLAKVDKVGEKDFFTDDSTAFISGKAALHIDGSYRLGSLKSQAKDLNYGVTVLPSYNGVDTSFGSFWTNGITTNATGDKLDASVKFLEYLTSTDVMKTWTQKIGEIGARTEIANDPELLKDDKLAPFIQQLPIADSYFYVDEDADRKALMDAIDKVLLNNVDPKQALDEATAQVQKLLDEYWGK